MKKIGSGTLKCIIVAGSAHAVVAVLRKHVASDDIREAGEAVCLVYTELEAAELRDLLSRELGDGGSILILEFDKWSGFGPDVDRDWLRARGH